MSSTPSGGFPFRLPGWFFVGPKILRGLVSDASSGTSREVCDGVGLVEEVSNALAVCGEVVCDDDRGLKVPGELEGVAPDVVDGVSDLFV